MPRTKEDLQKVNSGRVLYYDYLRVLATLGVIFIHISMLRMYNMDVASTDWTVNCVYDALSRWSVPMFVMISGALFLSKDVSVNMIYKKYLPRIIVALIFWRFIYFLLKTGDPVQQFLSLFGDGAVSRFLDMIAGYRLFWFLPMLAGLYICLPILKGITKNNTLCKYYLLLSFVVFLLLPKVNDMVYRFGKVYIDSPGNLLFSKAEQSNLLLFLSFTFYFIIGYIISKTEFTKPVRIVIYTFGIAGALFTVLGTYYLSLDAGHTVTTFFNFNRVSVMTSAVAVFELFKNIGFKQNFLSRFVSKLADYSFGVYLVHILIYEQYVMRFDIPNGNGQSLFLTPIISISLLFYSFVVSALLNRIPVIKKYIV
ncbi:MAG: acyltransferase family protein [Eubacteriales bacterium]|nr:acyltransferase family protein [Eubacteriales bacterium]